MFFFQGLFGIYCHAGEGTVSRDFYPRFFMIQPHSGDSVFMHDVLILRRYLQVQCSM